MPVTAKEYKALIPGYTVPELNWHYRGTPFNTGSSELNPDQMEILQATVGRLKDFPATVVKIKTHADGYGTLEENQILSDQRANTIRYYLMRHGISSSRMDVKGYGETQPIADNATEEGRYHNRRIEIISPAVKKIVLKIDY